MYNAINKNVPLVESIPKSFPYWYDKQIIGLIKRKNIIHKAWKCTKDVNDYIEFKRLRALVIRCSRNLYKSYVENAERNVSRNAKLFWSYVNKLKKNRYTLSTIKFGSSMVHSDMGISNVFADYVKTFYSGNMTDDEDTIDQNLCNLDLTISISDIDTAINKLKINGSVCPDSSPPSFVKNLGHVLSKPLHKLFNKSIVTSILPTKWKFSYITPTFKNGDRNSAKNYRPITIQNVIPKLLDSIITSKMYNHLVDQIVIQQYGFVSNKSVVSNLAIFTDFVSEQFDQFKQVDSIYIHTT